MDINERARLFGEKFAHDQEILFKTESRACRLFGLWVAEQLRLEKADAQTYARDMVFTNMEETGLGDVLRKAREDLDKAGISASDHLLQIQIENCLTQARIQIMEEGDK